MSKTSHWLCTQVYLLFAVSIVLGFSGLNSLSSGKCSDGADARGNVETLSGRETGKKGDGGGTHIDQRSDLGIKRVDMGQRVWTIGLK